MATAAPNIVYSQQPAEQTDFADNSFDLVTVAEALHWFRFDEFYKEVRRVGKPGGLFAAWAYSLLRISPKVDEIIETYHFETLKTYWDAERQYVDTEYRTVPLPFEEIGTPDLSIKYTWSPDDLEGYLNTWSALQKFIIANEYNPVGELMSRIRQYWPEGKKEVVFPIHLRAGKIDK